LPPELLPEPFPELLPKLLPKPFSELPHEPLPELLQELPPELPPKWLPELPPKWLSELPPKLLPAPFSLPSRGLPLRPPPIVTGPIWTAMVRRRKKFDLSLIIIYLEAFLMECGV
jgi:hypothetical protein